MQNGNGYIGDIWYGSKLNREPIKKIPFLGEFKLFYNLICEEVGNVVIGIFVDERLVQLYETKITNKYIGEEMCFWFHYPLRFKYEGTHTVSFAIGHQKQLSELTKKKDIEWINESRAFNITVEK